MEVYGKMAAQVDTGITVKNKKIVTDTVTVVKSELEIAEHEAAVALSAAAVALATAERATAKVDKLKADMLPAELDEDEEEHRLIAELKANRAKKAQRQANADIQRHRDRAKAEIQQLVDVNLRKIKELQEANDRHKQEQENIDKGVKDTVLTSHIVRQAEQIQLAPISPARLERPQRAEGEKRVRKTVTRPPLCDLITERLNFRWVGYTCNTENGKDFIEADGTVFRSLNAWTETLIERGGGGGRKVSVYVVVSVQNNTTKDWKNWGQVYTENCTSLQF